MSKPFNQPYKKPSMPSVAEQEEKKKEDLERMNDIIKDASGKLLFDGEGNVFTMLCGYKDAEGTLHKDFAVRDITGRDEEAVHRADTKSNVPRIVHTLLSRCVTRIGTYEKSKLNDQKWLEIIRSLYVGDQDWMLLKLREYSIGTEITVEHICPNADCKAKLKTVIEVGDIQVKEFVSDNVEFDLPRGYTDKQGNVHKTGVLNLPRGIDREVLMPLAKQNLAKAETAMLTRLMKFDDGFPVDDDVTANLTVRDRDYLSKLQQEYYFGLSVDLEITCDSCGETFTGQINAVNFL